MHCGVMVTGYNQGDWERLLAEDYCRPPAVSDAANMDDTLYLGELGRASRVRLHLGHRALRLRLFHAAESAPVPRVLGGAHASGRCGNGGHRGPVVESSATGQRDLHAGHLTPGASPSPRDRARDPSPRVRIARVPDRGIARVLLRRSATSGPPTERSASRSRRRLQDAADHHPAQARHKGELTTRIHEAITTEAAARMPPRTDSDRCSSPTRASPR